MYTSKAALDGITKFEDPRGLLKYIFIEDEGEYSFPELFGDFYFSEYLYYELDDFRYEELDDFDTQAAMEKKMDKVEKEYNKFGWEVSRFEDGDNYHFISYPKKNKGVVDILVKLVNKQ